MRLEQTKQTTIWFRRFQFNWILFSTESIKRMKTLDKFIDVYKIYLSVLVQLEYVDRSVQTMHFATSPLDNLAVV